MTFEEAIEHLKLGKSIKLRMPIEDYSIVITLDNREILLLYKRLDIILCKICEKVEKINDEELGICLIKILTSLAGFAERMAILSFDSEYKGEIKNAN